MSTDALLACLLDLAQIPPPPSIHHSQLCLAQLRERLQLADRTGPTLPGEQVDIATLRDLLIDDLLLDELDRRRGNSGRGGHGSGRNSQGEAPPAPPASERVRNLIRSVSLSACLTCRLDGWCGA
jgi:hypothetical protein